MILAAFSKHLQKHDEEILKGGSAVKILVEWIREILKRNPTDNVEKIITAEIQLAQNGLGDYLLVARSESGQILTKALYNFALAYEQHLLARWLENKSQTILLNLVSQLTTCLPSRKTAHLLKGHAEIFSRHFIPFRKFRLKQTNNIAQNFHFYDKIFLWKTGKNGLKISTKDWDAYRFVLQYLQ